MKRSILNKLQSALRSGDYKQCQHTLHNGTGYCCLGVAALVVGDEFEPGPDGGFQLKRDRQSDGFRSFSCLGSPTLRLLGITEGQSDTMVRWNDSEGKTFAEIADLLPTILNIEEDQ